MALVLPLLEKTPVLQAVGQMPDRAETMGPRAVLLASSRPRCELKQLLRSAVKPEFTSSHASPLLFAKQLVCNGPM